MKKIKEMVLERMSWLLEEYEDVYRLADYYIDDSLIEDAIDWEHENIIEVLLEENYPGLHKDNEEEIYGLVAEELMESITEDEMDSFVDECVERDENRLLFKYGEREGYMRLYGLKEADFR